MTTSQEVMLKVLKKMKENPTAEELGAFILGNFDVSVVNVKPASTPSDPPKMNISEFRKLQEDAQEDLTGQLKEVVNGNGTENLLALELIRKEADRKREVDSIMRHAEWKRTRSNDNFKAGNGGFSRKSNLLSEVMENLPAPSKILKLISDEKVEDFFKRSGMNIFKLQSAKTTVQDFTEKMRKVRDIALNGGVSPEFDSNGEIDPEWLKEPEEGENE